jgi:hypothetical protein
VRLLGEFIEAGTVVIAVTPTADQRGVAAELSSIYQAVWSRERLAVLAAQALAAAERGDDRMNLLNANALQRLLARQERRFDDLMRLTMDTHALVEASAGGDPYQLSDCYLHVAVPLMHLGRFAEARRNLERNEAVAVQMSRGMVAYAVAWWIELEALANEWSRVRDLEPRIREFVGDHVARRRVSTIRAVLLCAGGPRPPRPSTGGRRAGRAR